MSNEVGGSSASVARGSRFAKYFESKTRDAPGQPPIPQNYPPQMAHLESFPSNQGRFSQADVARFAQNQQGQAPPPELENLLTMLQNSSRVRPVLDWLGCAELIMHTEYHAARCYLSRSALWNLQLR